MEWANRFESFDIETKLGKVNDMNRWMKRRIERSRARCEREQSKNKKSVAVSEETEKHSEPRSADGLKAVAA